MPVVDVGGKKISYWIGRRGSLEGRDAILFVHGAGGGQLTWVYQKGFFEKRFTPVIIELPGHGESAGEGEQEIERYAEHVYLFARTLGLPKAFLVGHSMGGAIVLTLALTHPEIVKGIVLVGTGARLRVLPAILNGLKNNFEETVQKIIRFAYSRKASAELIEQGIRQLMDCRSDVLHGDFLACDRFDLSKEVERIILPTLVICGDKDELTPIKYSEFLHHRIKGSKLEIVPDAGHMVMMEAPEAFNGKIKDFVANPTSSGNS
jgi:pimeloyl-ACP methyl ester carboxylesterase